MFTMALEADATEHDHFIITFDLLESSLQNPGCILTITGKKLFKRSRETLRCFDQTRTSGIIASPADDRAKSLFYFCSIGSAGIAWLCDCCKFQGMHVRTHEL